MGFLSPKPPRPLAPPAPPPVARDNDDVEEARRKERTAARLRRGRAATILTSGAGLTGAAPIGRKHLLGE